MSELVQVRLVTTKEDAGTERAAAEARDYDVLKAEPVRLSPDGTPRDVTLRASLPDDALSEARFVDPVTITITATLATLAIRFANHWLQSREAGVQIDTRTTPVTISRLAGVPFGAIAVINADGTTSIHREAYEQPEDIVGKLPELLRIG